VTRTEEWQRLALWVAQPYAAHRDADDIRQEALLGAWRGMLAVRAKGLTRCKDRQAAVKGARWAVAEYLRRGKRSDRNPEPVLLSLDTHHDTDHDEEEWLPLDADHGPAIVERIGLEQALGALGDAERDLLRQLYWQEKSAQQIARERGCSFQRVWREAKAARARLKEALI
jgi:RNA polymerase sigma factor (sigma-70 family)